MLINCDMGEHLDDAIDQQLMPYVDQASIACGLHAGNNHTMRRTLTLAKQHNVSVGAHPSYDDKQGFGRRAQHCAIDAVPALLRSQIDTLANLAAEQGVALSYVKPHGALYNDMMADAVLRSCIMATVAEYPLALYLVLQADNACELYLQEAKRWGLALQFEAFADRCYADNGALLARKYEQAVHDERNTLRQVEQLVASGTVTTVGGKTLAIKADTVCLHGDNPSAIELASKIHSRIKP